MAFLGHSLPGSQRLVYRMDIDPLRHCRWLQWHLHHGTIADDLGRQESSICLRVDNVGNDHRPCKPSHLLHNLNHGQCNNLCANGGYTSRQCFQQVLDHIHANHVNDRLLEASVFPDGGITLPPQTTISNNKWSSRARKRFELNRLVKGNGIHFSICSRLLVSWLSRTRSFVL